MNRSDLVVAFQDTVAFSESDKLREKTSQASASSKVYLEDFQAHSHLEGHSAAITVEEDTTFSAARRYFVAGKTAVLNFANPVTPGGGAQNGAMAQEECLCRSSNLYVCLTSSPFLDYYQYNRSLHNHFYSDRIIYTKGVTVFKTDDEIPVLMPEQDWFRVDVITCAAPYIAKRKYTNRTALKSLFKGRIKNIFEVAIENGITTLILGAFGCGAFKNPPELVATAFYETINENRYAEQFDRIVFAIKKSGNNTNYHVFSETFCPLTVNCPEYTLDEIRLPSGKTIVGTTVGFANAPCNTTLDTVKEWVGEGTGCPVGRFGVSHVTPDENKNYLRYAEFVKWQVQNPFYKKQFSILGDSISTLDGYNPKGYNLFYIGDSCDRTGIHEMQDTWWGKVIDYFGGELLVNNSWSGSRVTKLPNRDTLFPSGCSDERTGGLHIGEVMPDVIIVYLGTNDWAFGASVEAERKNYGDNDELFVFAYRDMLDKVKRNYPNAEVFCCTLDETYMSSNPSFSFPHSYAGTHIEEYNEVIRRKVGAAGCKLIELYDHHIPYDAVDGTHPTAAGMNTLAALVLREMCKGAAFEPFYLYGDNAEDENCFAADNKSRQSGQSVVQKAQKEEHMQEEKPHIDLTGQIVEGKYELLKILGYEGTSQIYLGKNKFVNKEYTVKVYDKNTFKKNDAMRNLLLQEVHLMAKLDHPAIPKVVDIFEDERYFFVIREYMEGEMLSTLLGRNGALGEGRVRTLGIALADVLRYLHSCDPAYIYRDMKPENVMLTTSGEVKLIDFGAAMQYNPHAEDKVVLGTRGYASPEQYAGKSDPRTDIYALGLTLHQCVTGLRPDMPPYEAPPICQIKPELSKGLEYIICKCIEKNPEKRYQICTELIVDLNNIENLPPRKNLLSRLFRKKILP